MVAATLLSYTSALEADFPSTDVSKLSRHESWRKELHRPATYIQKWWAQRLGTVTRAILCAAVTDDRLSALRAYRSATRLSNLVVFDPFAGSGTTLVEAAKLGATVIGRDINPVATLAQRQALQAWDLEALEQAFEQVREACSSQISSLYRASDGSTVLYYFWVSVTACPTCAVEVELFSRHVFAQHAYPKTHPSAHAVCPNCHAIVPVNLAIDRKLRCTDCRKTSPFEGPVSGSGPTPGRHMRCRNGHDHTILNGARTSPLERHMYAKLVLTKDGSREYRPVDEFDRDLYQQARRLLQRHRSALVQPSGRLAPGYSTAQPLRWGFTEWPAFFNERQLFALGWTATAIRDLIPATAEREALIALFSKALEFNNVFTSYKGEGTGAVRSIFHNHTLKPERTPLEANLWGPETSSGSFSQLFQRLRRAHEYKGTPRDLLSVRNGHVTEAADISLPLARPIVETYSELVAQPGAAYISCGDSAVTDIPNGSVDLVVTDPPYVGKVHYSELADFFHAWLRPLKPFTSYPSDSSSTRSPDEVQNASVESFANGLTHVWAEVSRVLRDDGMLIFSFHQSDIAGWEAVMTALRDAGLTVTSMQPVVAEMATSVSKSAAHHPSNLDALVICRKHGRAMPLATTPELAASRAIATLRALRRAEVPFTAGDVTSVVGGAVLATLTINDSESVQGNLLQLAEATAQRAVSSLMRLHSTSQEAESERP